MENLWGFNEALMTRAGILEAISMTALAALAMGIYVILDCLGGRE